MALPPDPQDAEDRIPHMPGLQAPAAPVAGQAPPGQTLRRFIWFVLGLGTMLFLSAPTVMLVFFGLLPTIVAGIIDRTEGKHATYCVFGMNFSGIFPFLADVWFNNHSIDAAIDIMTDPFDLMVIYGAAGFGWMLYVAVPPVITTFLSVMAQRRVTVLREIQSKLIEEWGEAVATALETAEAGETVPE